MCVWKFTFPFDPIFSVRWRCSLSLIFFLIYLFLPEKCNVIYQFMMLKEISLPNYKSSVESFEWFPVWIDFYLFHFSLCFSFIRRPSPPLPPFVNSDIYETQSTSIQHRLHNKESFFLCVNHLIQPWWTIFYFNYPLMWEMSLEQVRCTCAENYSLLKATFFHSSSTPNKQTNNNVC